MSTRYLRVTSANKIYRDGVKLIELNKWYEVHHDAAIGSFIIGEKGKHGVITIQDIKFYSTYEPLMWVCEIKVAI